MRRGECHRGVSTWERLTAAGDSRTTKTVIFTRKNAFLASKPPGGKQLEKCWAHVGRWSSCVFVWWENAVAQVPDDMPESGVYGVSRGS